MTAPLQVFSNSDSPKPCDGFGNVNSYHADDDVFVKKDERMVAGVRVIGMVFVVRFRLAAILKKHLAANGVESAPFIVVGRCAKLIFGVHHIRRES